MCRPYKGSKGIRQNPTTQRHRLLYSSMQGRFYQKRRNRHSKRTPRKTRCRSRINVQPYPASKNIKRRKNRFKCSNRTLRRPRLSIYKILRCPCNSTGCKGQSHLPQPSRTTSYERVLLQEQTIWRKIKIKKAVTRTTKIA